MKKGILFCIIFLLFTPYIYASPIKTVSYQDKIENYISKYQHDTNKLIRVKNAISGYLLASEKTAERSIILRYFIDQIQKELLYKQVNGQHIETPENVKALYYSAYSASLDYKIDEIIELAKNTEINALVLDIKEVDGYISFNIPKENFSDIIAKSNFRIQDISTLITKLHENNIYIIGRIVVFKDNYLSHNYPDLAIKWSSNHQKTWTDYKGNSYSDPYSQRVWDYHSELASAAYTLGFDEINFDYVRFPTDGYISQTYYPFASKVQNSGLSDWRMQVMEEFSQYITNKLRKKHPDIILSADIFGLATHTDLYQIGQNIETFIPYFDYVAPMIYPSHYGTGYLGFTVPDNAPYQIFYDSIEKAQERIDALNNASSGALSISHSKIRPWLQAFHCTWCAGATRYDRTKFRKQIEALNDLGLDSWYVWNASGRYEPLWYNSVK